MKITHCRRGNHEYTSENTYIRTDGYRDCRTCMREHDRKYKESNREKIRESARKSYADDPEKAREKSRKYKASNPDKSRATSQRRLALKLDQMGRWPIPEHEFLALLFEIYPKCYYCEEALDDGYHEEHKIPLSRPEIKPDRYEGLHDFRNVRLSCIPCNLKKGTKTAEEFRAA